ncbi:hypothetical protein KP79_PYT20376 [Mizuhopecten yessoensis]|uniref:SEA domain-containing protein n=1 Tax=Mizuhopecten yessoensis TaxID=6573 RepID=A0A210QEP1_MIZYE|nr:hypothetical protein KP79_PYT20376 [Mizuhopecten yessoensis]
MDSWKKRFQGKWPRLTSMYSGSSYRLDEHSRNGNGNVNGDGKYVDPVLAYDNAFDPIDSYGAYNFHMAPREELAIGTDPRIWHRHTHKPDHDSGSDYAGSKKPDTSTCRVVLCVLLVMSFIGVVVASIVLAVILSQTQSSSVSPSPLAVLQGSLTMANRNFTADLNDPTSPAYKKAAEDFCAAKRERGYNIQALLH